MNYWICLVGAIFVVLIPGSNILFILKNGISSGMKGGCLVACGVFIGDAVLMFLAWTGVVTLIRTTPILSNVIRYLGASYLLYLGSKILYTALKGRSSETKPDELQYGAISRRVLTLSPTNPKATLFYVSLFVQFIGVNAPHMGTLFFTLATTLELVGFRYLSSLIISRVFVTQHVRTKRRLARVGSSLTGSMFVGFVVRLVTLQS